MMNDRKLNTDKWSDKINAIEQLCKVIIECVQRSNIMNKSFLGIQCLMCAALYRRKYNTLIFTPPCLTYFKILRYTQTWGRK